MDEKIEKVDAQKAPDDAKTANSSGGVKRRLDAAPASDQLQEGDLVAGRFKIIAKLGHGGFSVVYKVEQVFLKEIMALKVLSLNNPTDTAVARFQKEALLCRRMDHPNIVKVHDGGTVENGQPYFAMEFVEGLTLSELVKKRGALPMTEAIDLFVQIADGLAYAHKMGIVHRDLKPSNFMLSKTDQGGTIVKIVDFGIAKLAYGEGEQSLTTTGDIFGSPLYMSPEQCQGGAIDHRADIYSFGCALFEALAGVPPFYADSTLGVLMLHQSSPPSSMKTASMGQQFPESLEGVIARLLAKEPALRYQTIEDVKHDLELIRQNPQVDLSLQSKASMIKTGAHSDLRTWQKPESLFLLVVAAGLLIAIMTVVLPCMEKPKGEVTSPKSPVKSQPAPAAEKPEPMVDEMISQDGPFAPRSIKDSGQGEWVLQFPNVKGLGFLRCLAAKTEAERVWRAARGEVRLPVAAGIKFDPGYVFSKQPLLFRHFRPDEIRELAFKKTDLLTNDSLECITHLSGLVTLSVNDTKVSDVGLTHIANLAGLRELDIAGTAVTGDLVGQLKFLPRLTRLTADDIKGANFFVDELARHGSNLDWLSMEGDGLTDADVAKLSKIKSLTVLHLSGNAGITDRGIASLVALKHLRELNISNCHVTPASIKSLSQMPALEELRFTPKGWSNQDKLAIKAALSRCKILVPNGDNEFY